MFTEELVYKNFQQQTGGITMLECIRHRAKSTEETNAKLYGGQNNRQTDKNQKETPKTVKEK